MRPFARLASAMTVRLRVDLDTTFARAGAADGPDRARARYDAPRAFLNSSGPFLAGIYSLAFGTPASGTRLVLPRLFRRIWKMKSSSARLSCVLLRWCSFLL